MFVLSMMLVIFVLSRFCDVYPIHDSRHVCAILYTPDGCSIHDARDVCPILDTRVICPVHMILDVKSYWIPEVMFVLIMVAVMFAFP
jgi:hypothetical protein